MNSSSDPLDFTDRYAWRSWLQELLATEAEAWLVAELEAALRREKGALAAYRGLPDSKKKQYMYWLQSAKREQTKLKRIEEVVKQVLDSP